MTTLLMYEIACFRRDTMIDVDFDSTSDFDRMDHENINIPKMRKKVDYNMCKYVSPVINGMRKNVQTFLILSKKTTAEERTPGK